MSEDNSRRNRQGLYRSLAVVVCLAVAGWSVYLALTHPATPLPRAWNPTLDLKISDPVSGLTNWKLTKVQNDPALCLSVLAEMVEFTLLEPKRESESCHIETRVLVSRVGAAKVEGLETSCAVALRLAMWENHGIQPIAERTLNANVSEIHQIGSYNCRKIRTTGGNSERMSLHATAEAVDITGFTLSNGKKLTLISDWAGATDNANFLKETKSSGCKWFRTVLSPEYNALHADHFHMQSRGWGTCR